MTDDRRTRTADDAPAAEPAATHAYLVRALAYDRPTQAPARWSLDATTEVTLSGGGPAGATRTGATLAIACDDAWASTRHAAIRFSFGRWIVEDLGSKNGTFVDGERITRHALDDGDLVEIGRTAWWFRELAAPVRDAVAGIASPTDVGRAAPPQAVRSGIASPTDVGRAAPPQAVRSVIASPTDVGRAAPPQAVRSGIASPTDVGRAAPPQAVRSVVASPTDVGRAAPPQAVRSVIAREFVTLHAPLEHDVARAVAAVAAGVPVLVRGETGAGKERFVAAVHAASGRPGAFVAVNCAALPATLVEGELFGHKKGAFSGAGDDRVGYIRAAHRGTLLLDEIGDMPLPAQAGLLRVLAEREVIPLGDERPIPVDVAVVSATHRDLASLRPDLLARIRGVEIEIPALRERREDIGIFIARTLARVAPDVKLAPAAARRLLLAAWPLNVRELEHAVADAALRAKFGSRTIGPDELAGVPPIAPPPVRRWSPEDAALRDQLVAALDAHAGNISAVARELGRDRKQIHRWIARFAIDVRRE